MTEFHTNKSANGDAWSNWVLTHRHAGDAAYQRVVRGMVERIRDRVLDGARLAPGMTVADVGTGDGLIALGAIARVGPSLQVILTDISAPLLEHAKQAARELGVVGQCTFVEGTAEKLAGIDDATVDVLMTRAVLAYVPEKAAALREFIRVLKPGGRMSIAEPIFRDRALEALALTKAFGTAPPQGIPSFPHLLQRWKAAQFPTTEEQIAQSPIASYTERDLVHLARDAGFADLHLELHIDERPSSITSWDIFIGTAPHPLAPPLKEILATQFNAAERLLFERVMRPQVESGKTLESDSIAYMTAVKPVA
jgi:arsenite methyltransferase